MQLQAKPIQRAPLIVEEVPVARSASDGRIASPLPQAIPLPVNAGDPSSPYAATQGVNPAIPTAPPAPVITGMTPVGPDAYPPGEVNVSVAGLGLDIGAMISTTIQSSMPPPLHTPEQGFAPAPPPSSPLIGMPGPAPHATGSAPPAPPSSPSVPAAPPSERQAQQNLTSEQSSLKQKILERAAQISSQDYFQMLGLERDATPEAVQKAFFGLAKVWHPDRLPPALVDVKDACSKVFTHLTEAQATLDRCRATRRVHDAPEGRRRDARRSGEDPRDPRRCDGVPEGRDLHEAQRHRAGLRAGQEGASRSIPSRPTTSRW